MPKTSSSQRLGKRNRERRRKFWKKNNLPPGWKWKREMQGLKRAVKNWKGPIGSGKGRTVFQLMLTMGPTYSSDVDVYNWGRKIADVLEIPQEDAEGMVRKAGKLKEGEKGIILKENEDKATLEKAQRQMTSGFSGVSSNALEIQEK